MFTAVTGLLLKINLGKCSQAPNNSFSVESAVPQMPQTLSEEVDFNRQPPVIKERQKISNFERDRQLILTNWLECNTLVMKLPAASERIL